MSASTARTANSVSTSVVPITVASGRELDAEFQAVFAAFVGDKETEENWEQRDKAIQRVRSLVAGHAYEHHDSFQANLKQVMDVIMPTLHSLRSALVSSCCSLVADLAVHLTSQLDPHVDRLMANLLKLTAQSKRMLVTLGTAAAITLLRNTSYQPRIVERLAEAASDKNAATRERATEFLRVTLELCFERESGRALFVRAGGLETMERVLVKTLGDANNMVRERSREVFGLCRQHWPERCEAFTHSLDTNVKKSLARSVKTLSAKSGARTATSALSRSHPLPRASSAAHAAVVASAVVPKSAEDDSCIMEATTCTDGEPAAAAITLDRLLQDVSNPENPHRVQIIHQINSYLHDAAHRQQELDEEAVKQFAALLYDHDHEVVESLLGQIFPLLLQEQHIQEWIAQALPHILAQRRGHAKAVDALLRKVLERMPADAVLDGIILAVSTNPFVLFRPLYGYQKEKELRLFIQRRGLEWLRDIMDMRDDAGEAALNIPPNYTHSLLNRIIPLCELLAEEEQAALGQVLRSLHTQSSAVFGAVLTTFDSLIQAKVAAMVPEYEMAADDDAMEEVQECRPEERDGAGDLSFAMPSFSQYEKEDSSFAMHVDTDDIMVEEEQRLAELGEDTIGAPSNTTTPVVVRTVPGHSKVAVMTTPVSEQYPRALPRQLGGLIGHNKGIALTPLASLKHADLHLGEIASPCSVATDHTPTNKSVAAGASSADADARLTRILKRLAGGQSTDAHFLKLSSMAEKYVRERDHGSSFGAGSGGKSERVRVYCERFPEVLSTLLGVLDMPDERIANDPIVQKENALIVLKHMLDQHFELFRGLESGLVRKVLQARAMGEADTLERLSNTNDKMSVIASEIFEKLAYSMEPATMTACIMETLEGARREDVLVGVCFLELGRLVELRYAAAAKTGNFYALETELLEPILETRRLVQAHIQSNPIVGNRKAVYHFLASVWRVMGDGAVLVSKYLATSVAAPCINMLEVVVMQEERSRKAALASTGNSRRSSLAMTSGSGR